MVLNTNRRAFFVRDLLIGTHMKLEDLQNRLQELKTENESILAKAEAEKRELSIEEGQSFDSNQSAFDATTKNIERLQRDSEQHEMLTRGTGRVTQPNTPSKLAVEEGEERPVPKHGTIDIRPLPPTPLKNGGFRSLGEMAKSVHIASRHGGEIDPRLQRLAAASTIGSEGVGSDGGFAVPPDFRNAIMQTVLGEDSLLGRCDQVPVSGNTFTCPADETTPWQTSGGIQAYWDGEAAAATQSKPNLQEKTVKLNKIRCLVPMTDELLEDASAMDAYLRRKAPEKIAFKLNLAIIQGSGVGQPLGILNSGALVTVSKAGSQVADTLTAGNIIAMYSRMYAPSRSKAVWLINQDIEPQLLTMSVAGKDETGSGVTGFGGLVYMPANGLSGAPYGTLFGRPVIPTQACETLGDKGDIIFADMSQYLALIKAGQNPKVETSMHLWFDQDVMAFKFVLRVGGMPWWSTTTAARDGSATYSPFVTIEAR